MSAKIISEKELLDIVNEQIEAVKSIYKDFKPINADIKKIVNHDLLNKIFKDDDLKEIKKDANKDEIIANLSDLYSFLVYVKSKIELVVVKYVGMSSDPVSRKAHWESQYPSLKNWRIVKSGLTYNQAQDLINSYMDRGYKGHPGGEEKSGNVYSVYAFECDLS